MEIFQLSSNYPISMIPVSLSLSKTGYLEFDNKFIVSASISLLQFSDTITQGS